MAVIGDWPMSGCLFLDITVSFSMTLGITIPTDNILRGVDTKHYEVLGHRSGVYSSLEAWRSHDVLFVHDMPYPAY